MILKKITIISFLTTILVVIKYALGFVVGIEIVTFLCILYATLLPIKMWSQIIIAFILITGIIYGFGLWWVMYWFIFPTQALFSWMFKKVLLKHNLIFALWCGIWSFSIMFWYYPYDVLINGHSYAINNFVTAFIPNLLGAVSNFVVGIVLMEPCKKVFQKHLKINDLNYWVIASNKKKYN